MSSRESLDPLAVGETLVDFISVEQTDWLRNRATVAFVSSTSGRPDFEIARSGDYRLRPEEVSEEAVERARVVHAFALSREPCRLAHEQGKTVSLDPNYSARIWPHHKEARHVLQEMYRYINITKPSLDDAGRIFSREYEPEQYIEMFHDLGAEVVIFTSSGGVVTVSGARDSFWAGLLVAHLDGNDRPACVKFAHEVAKLELRVEGHLERMIDRRYVYDHLDAAVEQKV